VSVLGKGSTTTRLVKRGKIRLSSRLEGTYRHRGKDELTERKTRPPETSLKAAVGRNLLGLVIQRVYLISGRPRRVPDVSDPHAVLLELQQQACT
jgi:hypothetical protein